MTLPKDPEKAKLYLNNMREAAKARALLLPPKVRKDICKKGYVVLHFRNWPGIGTKRMYEHRFVMEQKLGRKLLTSELVHHIDKNKQNNDLNNLELTDIKKHQIEHLKGKKRPPYIGEASRKYMLSLPFEERRKRGIKGGSNSGPGLKKTLSKLTKEERMKRTEAARLSIKLKREASRCGAD